MHRLKKWYFIWPVLTILATLGFLLQYHADYSVWLHQKSLIHGTITSTLIVIFAHAMGRGDKKPK
jgi:cytochrome c oxidase subunit IV